MPDRSRLEHTQNIVRCMIGSAMVFDSLPLLTELASSAAQSSSEVSGPHTEHTYALLSSIDGDLVQAMTAVEKALMTSTGTRTLTQQERQSIMNLHDKLNRAETVSGLTGNPYSRGLNAVAGILGITVHSSQLVDDHVLVNQLSCPAPPRATETFRLGDSILPRIFSGLWQLSSPAWGSASASKINDQFNKHIQSGFTAFDMADHYGDAEVIFGRFRASYFHKQDLFAATKFCVFQKMVVSREAIAANVSERCRRLQQPKLDLLQFHWQHYDNLEYLDALRYLQQDSRIGLVGLCNFDTSNMQRVIDEGIQIHSNQVQFSLVDSRPVEKMGAVCSQHNIKLLTYGTLCGGFLSDKWLNQPEPDLYGGTITPSQRKYFSMICNWGGWALFQELLHTLGEIAKKHNVSISNVATRWVLDFPYVGAVIVGARMGVSDHSGANTAAFGWRLDEKDQADIGVVLQKSRRVQMFEQIGDCGAEYRL